MLTVGIKLQHVGKAKLKGSLNTSFERKPLAHVFFERHQRDKIFMLLHNLSKTFFRLGSVTIVNKDNLHIIFITKRGD